MESYEDLLEDTKLWLEGFKTVNIVVPAKFFEEPSYENPVSSLSKEKRHQFYHDDKGGLDPGDVTVVGINGPAKHKEIQWVGKSSVAFVEIRTRNAVTGHAEKRGSRLVCF